MNNHTPEDTFNALRRIPITQLHKEKHTNLCYYLSSIIHREFSNLYYTYYNGIFKNLFKKYKPLSAEVNAATMDDNDVIEYTELADQYLKSTGWTANDYIEECIKFYENEYSTKFKLEKLELMIIIAFALISTALLICFTLLTFHFIPPLYAICITIPVNFFSGHFLNKPCFLIIQKYCNFTPQSFTDQ